MAAIFRCLFLVSLELLGFVCYGQGEPFSKRTVISGLNSPWEITYGPNDSLWTTENVTYLVKRIDISSGNSTTLLNLSSLKNFTSGDAGRWPQGGLMGMALHPALYDANPAVRNAKPWVYLAYVYDRPTGQGCSTNANASGTCLFHTRIVRYEYRGNALINPVIILDAMPGSNDHNSGRLRIGPDLKLYYTIGDMGAGQFNNASRTNNAQNVDVLEGKVLRLNTETDGDSGADAWVPDDNPFYNSASITPRDYVYTMGHRNAQGIVWASVNGTNILYNSEHGDKSDDEVNRLEAGANYGWNQVSGYCDGNYDGLTLGGRTGVNEGAFCSSTTTEREPLTTLFTMDQSGINALSSDYLTWPTVAPSSIDYYSQTKIPGWNNSLLITCLKAGRVYRIRLNSTGTGLLSFADGTDTTSYFRGLGRFRDLAISPDGLKIYLACDASGQTSGPTGSFNNGGVTPPNGGSILEMTYTGVLMAITDKPKPGQRWLGKGWELFPNPVTNRVSVRMQTRTGASYTLKVLDLAGRVRRNLICVGPDISADLSSLAPGFYILQVFSSDGALLVQDKLLRQ